MILALQAKIRNTAVKQAIYYLCMMLITAFIMWYVGVTKEQFGHIPKVYGWVTDNPEVSVALGATAVFLTRWMFGDWIARKIRCGVGLHIFKIVDQIGEEKAFVSLFRCEACQKYTRQSHITVEVDPELYGCEFGCLNHRGVEDCYLSPKIP